MISGLANIAHMAAWAQSSAWLSPWPTTIMSVSFRAFGPESPVVLQATSSR